jgi:hypothetical protein
MTYKVQYHSTWLESQGREPWQDIGPNNFPTAKAAESYIADHLVARDQWVNDTFRVVQS